MVWKTIFYVSLLIAFILFVILREKGFSFKNSLLMSLFAPVIGGLFILAGTLVAVFASALLIFGGVAYLFNKEKFMGFNGRNLKFKVYKV